MSKWDLDPKVVALLVDGIEEVASWAWKRIAGDDGAEKLIELRKAAAEAAALALHSEVVAQATLLGLKLQVDALGDLSQAVLDSMDALEASRRVVPPLDIIIEEM